MEKYFIAAGLWPAKTVSAAPIRAVLDKMNVKNWRTVKKKLLAILTATVVEF